MSDWPILSTVTFLPTVGALLVLHQTAGGGALATVLGTLAVITAAINVVGGYLVTDRMLGMFKKKGK